MKPLGSPESSGVVAEHFVPVGPAALAHTRRGSPVDRRVVRAQDGRGQRQVLQRLL